MLETHFIVRKIWSCRENLTFLVLMLCVDGSKKVAFENFVSWILFLFLGKFQTLLVKIGISLNFYLNNLIFIEFMFSNSMFSVRLVATSSLTTTSTNNRWWVIGMERLSYPFVPCYGALLLYRRFLVQTQSTPFLDFCIGDLERNYATFTTDGSTTTNSPLIGKV